MKTILVNDKQLGIEDVYLDLDKLSEEQIKSIPDVLEENDEPVSFYVHERLSSNKLLSVYFSKDFFLWTVANKSSLPGLYEITYSQFLELIGEPKQEKIREKEISQEDGSLYIGEGLENYYIDQLTRTNKYFVFPKAPEGDFPDLSGFKGDKVKVRFSEKDMFYPTWVKAKFGRRSFKTDCGTVKEIEGFHELTPEEIVEKLGKDYLLNLIKEKENEI